MKSCRLVLAACSLVVASTGFAQVKNFEGASLYASTGYDGWSLDLSNYSGNSNVTWDTFKPAAVPLNIGFSYTWALGDKNTFGISAETNPLRSSTATGTQYYKGAAYDTADIYVDSYYDVSVAPGILISKDTLLYGKLGYYSVKGVGDSSSFTQTGYSYGIGAKTLLNAGSGGGNLYVFGEVKARSGNTVSQSVGSNGYTIDMKAGGTSYLVGLGVNF
jgi:hypothetical protein